MSLLGLRTAIVDYLAANLTQFETVQAHGGGFDRGELMRVAMKSPAAMVAVLGGEGERQSGQSVINPTIVVSVVTRGTSAIGDRRDASALTLSELVLNAAVNNEWAYEHAQAPTEIKAVNLYSGAIDNTGVALWAVSWKQQTDIAVFDETELDDFESLHADFDMAPADGTIDLQAIIFLHGAEFMSSYGHLDISSAVPTNLTEDDTYKKVAGTTTLAINSDDVDMPADNRIRYTGATPKPFICDAVAAIELGAGSPTKITLAFYKNGVLEADSAMPQYISQTADPETITLKHTITLSQNDYLEVWVKAASAVATTITNMHVNIAAV